MFAQQPGRQQQNIKQSRLPLKIMIVENEFHIFISGSAEWEADNTNMCMLICSPFFSALCSSSCRSNRLRTKERFEVSWLALKGSGGWHLEISEFPRKFKFDECHRHIIQLKVSPTCYKTLPSATGNQIEGKYRPGKQSTSSLSNSTAPSTRNLFFSSAFSIRSTRCTGITSIKMFCKCRLQVKPLNFCPNRSQLFTSG